MADSVPAPEPRLLDEEIVRVADAVEARLQGRPAPELPAEQADRVAILDALRSRSLEAWPRGDETGLLATMRAFEAVREQLSPDRAPGALPSGILSPYGHRLLREVAHTMRSPLGSIAMLVATLRDADAGDMDPLQRTHLGLVYRATTALAHLSNDLLALTGEEEEVDPAPVAFPAGEILENVAGVVAPIAAERGAELRSGTEGVGSRVGRPRALARALTNLALNAALMVREGRLSLTASGEGDEVTFAVEATAAVQAPEEVFDVFPLPPGARDYTLSQRALGFAVARRLVRRMGSEIVVERGGEGGLVLSFRLALPRADGWS